MPRPSRYPLRIEARHQRRIAAYVDALQVAVDDLVIGALPRMYTPIADGAHEAGIGEQVESGAIVLVTSIRDLRRRWHLEIATNGKIVSTAKETAAELDGFNARSAAASVRSAGAKVQPETRAVIKATGKKTAAETAKRARLSVGVAGGGIPGEPIAVQIVRGSAIEPLMPAWIEAHTDLIVRGGMWRGRVVTPIGEQAITEIQAIVQEGFTAGLRHEEIADQIHARLGVIRSRANLIGRDQVNKLNGRLIRARFEAAGLMRYTWRTSRDERVRETHAALEGTEWSFQFPPTIGNPGEEINCRCNPEPLMKARQTK